MLRVLGYRARGLISILTIRTVIFAVPGFILGMWTMLVLLNGAKIGVYYFSMFNTYIEVDNFTILMVRYEILKCLEYFYGNIGTSVGYNFTYQ